MRTHARTHARTRARARARAQHTRSPQRPPEMRSTAAPMDRACAARPRPARPTLRRRRGPYGYARSRRVTAGGGSARSDSSDSRHTTQRKSKSRSTVRRDAHRWRKDCSACSRSASRDAYLDAAAPSPPPYASHPVRPAQRGAVGSVDGGSAVDGGCGGEGAAPNVLPAGVVGALAVPSDFERSPCISSTGA